MLMALAPVLAATADDAVPASQPDGRVLGTITGRLTPADAVKGVECIDREFNLPYRVEWDAKAGRFTVPAVAPGRRYDLTVRTSDGKTFRGVDLSFEEDPLLRLVRKQRGDAPEEPPGPLTEKDRGEIDDVVTKIESFENAKRIMELAGDHSRATALVELRRTTPFHSGRAGEQIRRVELWYFKFQYGGWAKVPNAERVLSRERAPAAQIEQLIRTEIFVQQLGGILVGDDGRSPPLEVNLPGYPAAATSQPDDATGQSKTPSGDQP
ncbi:MAG: hypothetical protein BIFFINMI_01271 [Phycisphaerae bacterium]|nr:hypothetical protein [Phycisphaerae bacterium]